MSPVEVVRKVECKVMTQIVLDAEIRLFRVCIFKFLSRRKTERQNRERQA